MKPSLSILVIEDDKYARLNAREILQPFGPVDEASSFDEATTRLLKNTYDIVITDIELGDDSGAEIIPLAVKRGFHCIVVSSFEDDSIVETAYARGASHFLSKYKLKDQLPQYIHKFLQAKNDRLQRFIAEEFVTQDIDLLTDLRALCKVNLKNQSLFISGPTGTGKSALGKLFHELTSPEGNLVHINCSEVAENLLESELFGHEKGAFTGADQKKEGKLSKANGGTLFLDEVGTMPLPMQQKLLKALDEKTFYPVGSTIPVKSNFTLISATCEDLQEKIQRREFREDLYFRISGHHLHLPALAQRTGDIELLMKHFQKRSPRRFVIRPEAMEILKKYSWPGNVRELAKTCERFSQTLSGVIDQKAVSKLLSAETNAALPASLEWEEYVLKHGLRAFIAQLEKRAVEESMKRNNGKITTCIKELKISSSAFYRILQENQLQL